MPFDGELPLTLTDEVGAVPEAHAMKRMGFTHFWGRMPIQRLGVTQRYADCVMHGGVVYLVEVPANPGDDISGQTASLLARVDTLLAQAGSNKSSLLMVTVYLADMADYEAMNAIWDAWIPPGEAPARACVQARLANRQWRIEIALTAALG